MKSLLAAAVVASALVFGANTAQAHDHSGYRYGPVASFGLFFGTPSYSVRPAYRHHRYYHAPPRWGHKHWQRHRHWKGKHDWKRHDDDRRRHHRR